MPKGSPELTEKRKNEILDACEKIYRAQGFFGVTIKENTTAGAKSLKSWPILRAD